MTKNKRFKFVEIGLLAMIWIVLITAPVLFRKDMEFEWSDWDMPLITIIPLFVLFLINRFLLVPYLLFRKKHILYFLTAAILIAVLTIGLHIFDTDRGPKNRAGIPEQGMQHRPLQDRPDPGMHMPPPNPGPGPVEGRPVPPFANFLIFSVLMVGFDTGLRFSFKMADAEREKAKLEKENSETQLAFLRNQVSPHFFMNTLNNIHALIDFDTGEAKESIIRLSKLMRHLLYDSEIEKIPIHKEMEFIKNYVDLMKLRFSEKVKVKLNIPDNLPDKSIPPLLFTSFVENAFKHGISYKNGSYINIEFTYSGNKFNFNIENSISEHEPDDAPSGIGVKNARKRLDLLYGEDYTLEIEDRKERFIVHLSIPV